MKNAQKRFTRTVAALAALMLVLSVLSPIGMVAAVDGITVTQQADSTTVTPGDTMTFTTDVSVDNEQIETSSIGLQTDRPDGWEITRQNGEFLGHGPDGWLWFSTTGVSGSDTVQYTVEVPSDAESGDYDISVTASTSDGEASTTDTTTISVEPEQTNTAPTADAGDDQTVEEGDTVTLDASESSDPDGDSLSYSWTVADDAGTSVSLSDADTATPTFTAPSVDSETTLSFQIEVADGNDGTDSDSVSVTVQPTQPANQAPTIDAISDQTVTEGDSATVPVSADDPDGDTVSLSLSQAPDFVSLANGELTIASQSGDAGTYTVEVTADDGQATTTESFQLTVEELPNQSPTAAFSHSPTDPEVGEDVTFDASASEDSGGSIASYEWDFGDGSTDSGESVTHTFSSPGDYDVELTVTDDDGATDTTTQTVSVAETAAPANFQISAIDVESPVTQGDTATVSATVENTGDEGTQTVVVAVDGATVDSQDVTLAGGASDDVTFEVATDSLSVGDHDVDLSTANDSASGQLTVTEPEPPADDLETSVSLSPANGETFVGGATTYELVVDDAQGGVGAYEATVSLDDPSVGSITDVSLQGSPAGQTTNVDVASDGSSVEIDAALMDTADSGSVPVATITVQGDAAGATDLSASVSALGNEAGNSYTVTGTQGASLSVTEKSTSVSLSPTSNEVATGDTTTFDLVVDNAEGGVGAYTATVSVDDPSVGSITDVELQGDPAEGTSEANIAADGSSVAIDAALMNTADSGSVVVATITVQGEAAGSTSLSTAVEAIADEDATTYAVTGTNGASLTVTEITVGNYTSPVTDVDDDGVYEDINGDGEFNIVDIQGLFVNLDDEAVQDNPSYFDFNGDGTVDVVDVQALFNELTT
ncbi:PKD domain-containing protein [Halobellus inordinatus]|uniref:PKD domain-containing protein n=1 Tax=Halobellus inordinatus TaxID=1126236 RepID=UPI00210C81EE|nr:PKD domain-containing protein [Halobellus inordinatus]